MNNDVLKVEQFEWHGYQKTLRHIRTEVFIKEQHVPEELEWDEFDETCVHVIAERNGEPVATGRLLETGQIGRMAVLLPFRKTGVGSKILEKLLSIARSKKMNSVFLNAQVDAIAFYEKFGFKEEDGVFDDAGIPHKKMTRNLD